MRMKELSFRAKFPSPKMKLSISMKVIISRGLASSLNRSEPPLRIIEILQPGEVFEFRIIVRIDQDFSYYERRGKHFKIWDGAAKDEVDPPNRGIALSDIPAFTIEYQYPFATVYKYPDLLEKLQSRWRKFGVLPVDTSGDFSITSGRIVNLKERN